MLYSEQTLCSNPIVSNVHAVIYLLFSIFRRLFGGTLLSPPRPPCDRFPYGLASPMDTYAWGLRRMSAPPPLMSQFVGMAGYAPTSFHDLVDDEVESDGSASVMSWHLATLCPGSALWRMLRDSRRW